MKLTVDKNRIVKGLQKAAAIIPTKPGVAYLRSVWLKAEGDTLGFMATDANIEIMGSYPAEIADGGLVGVQGKAFCDLVAQLPSGGLDFSLDESSGNLLLKQGRRSYRLPVSNREWFQEFTPLPEDGWVAWSGDVIEEILHKVMYCIADDAISMESLACICLRPVGEGRIDACGINGQQCALHTFTNDDLASILPREGLLVQKKHLQDLRRWLDMADVELALTDRRVFIRSADGGECLSLPRASHDYVDYNAFIKKFSGDDVSAFTVNRQEFMDTLQRATIFAGEEDPAILRISDQEVLIEVRGQEKGSGSEGIEISGRRGSMGVIAFPPKPLIKILEHFTSESVTVDMTSDIGPCRMSGDEDPGYVAVFMPMQLTESAYYREEEA